MKLSIVLVQIFATAAWTTNMLKNIEISLGDHKIN